MKTSEVYLRAAEFALNGSACVVKDCGYPCCAMAKATPDDHNYYDAKYKFLDMFDGGDWQPHATPQQIEISALSLCLMSAIAADEEHTNRKDSK